MTQPPEKISSIPQKSGKTYPFPKKTPLERKAQPDQMKKVFPRCPEKIPVVPAEKAPCLLPTAFAGPEPNRQAGRRIRKKMSAAKQKSAIY